MFHDYLELKTAKLSKARLKSLKDNFVKDKKGGLDVILTPSYAGYRTGNRMMYLPTDFQKSIIYWTDPYPRPIQRHHEDGKDAIGRVVSVKYVDTSEAYRSNPMIMKFISPNTPLEERLDLVDAVLSLHQQEDFKGLGHFRMHAKIFDKDAIEKVLDGRYLTLSSGYSPTFVYCTVCHRDLRTADGDDCPHRFGKVDEETGRIPLMVPVDQVWEETSYVNIPAIDLCTTEETGDVTVDSKMEDYDKSEIVARRSEYVMLYNDGSKVYSLHNDNEWVIRDEFLDVIDQDKPQTQDKDEGNSVIGSEMNDSSELTMFEQLCDYSNISKELDEMGFKDATLSAAQRKKLKAGTFCGPDRSFPCPDCAHVRAARRLIGRYKGPGDKTKILACVNKKAKMLGCDKAADMLDTGEETMNEFLQSMIDTKTNYALLAEYIPEASRLDEAGLAALEDKVFLGSGRTYPAHDKIHADACKQVLAKFEKDKEQAAYKLVDEALTIRLEELAAAVQDTQAAPAPAAEAPAQETPAVTVESLQAQVAELTKQVGDSKKGFEIETGIYQKKIDKLTKDIKDLEAVNTSLQDDLHNVLATTISQLQILRNEEVTNSETLKTKSNDELKGMIKDLATKQTPSPAPAKETPAPAVVDNPSLSGAVPPPKETIIADAREKYAVIAREYDELKKFKGDFVAKAYLSNCKIQGFIPSEVVFE